MKTSLATIVLALVLAAIPLSAHHSWPVSFEKLVTVKGTVMDFTWENPHPMMTLEVKTDDGKVKCYGANTCKGSGACGGAGHACAGKNGCKGQGFTKADSEDACLKMAGGRLTAEAPKK